MNADPRQTLLVESVQNCRLLAQRLSESQSKVSKMFPIQPAAVAALHPGEIETLDALIKRYMQLLSTLQDRVFRGIALLEEEDIQSLSRKDIANFMEKIGALDSSTRWSKLLLVRNQLAHEYPKDPVKQAARLNDTVAAVPDLLAVVDQAARFLASKGIST